MKLPPMKWQTNESLSCSKFATEDASNLLNHTLAALLRVAGKDLQITLFEVCWRFKIVLKALMWLRGSFVPSWNSSCDKRNFRGKGHSKSLAVKGKSVHLSMPSRFIIVFPFMEFFILLSSLRKLFIM